MALNESQRRALVSGFAAVDGTLREIEAGIASASASPFAKYVVDFSPTEQRTVLDYVSRAREQMLDGLRSLGIAVGRARSSVRGPVQIGMTFAGITVDEVAPPRLRGYGPMDEATSLAVERVLADVARTLRTLRAYVVRDASTDVPARLEKLERGLPLDLGLLRRLDDIVTRRGLVELRSSLVSIVERLETRTFDIAVFGRVSSGKSSLLNAVLGAALLPVGVTPVTAFPTRISWALQPRATVAFVDGRKEVVSLDRIADYVTEQNNPDNAKRVARVEVGLPAESLRAHVTLVDTPGVGSLARMGARETYAYLPSCDLGVVVIDGMSPPGTEDFRLLARLLDSGIEAKVVLSKEDLVSDHDRQQLRAYVGEAIRRELGVKIVPAWIRSVGAEPTARGWFDRELAPLVAEGESAAERSLRRKLELVRTQVVAALGSSSEEAPSPVVQACIDALGAAAQRLLEASEQRAESLISRVRDLAPRLVRELAQRIASRANGELVEAVVGSVIASILDEACLGIRNELAATRDSLAKTLTQMALLLGEAHLEPELRLDFLTMPSPALPPKLTAFRFDARRWPAPLRAKRIESRLVDAGDAIYRMLSDLRIALRAWARGELARLGDQFAAQADPLRARVHRDGGLSVSAVDDLRALGAAPPPGDRQNAGT